MLLAQQQERFIIFFRNNLRPLQVFKYWFMCKKKILLYFFLPVLIVVSQAAIAQNYSSIIKAQGMEMAKAVLAKDVDKLVKYIHPKMVEAAGGKEKMMMARDTANKYMQQFGAEIKKVTIGNPAPVVSYKNELQTTLPQTTEVKFMASTVILESTLIAISQDKGEHWYFIDTSIYHMDKVKKSLPDLSPALVIPPMKQPKIITEQ